MSRISDIAFALLQEYNSSDERYKPRIESYAFSGAALVKWPAGLYSITEGAEDLCVRNDPGCFQ